MTTSARASSRRFSVIANRKRSSETAPLIVAQFRRFSRHHQLQWATQVASTGDAGCPFGLEPAPFDGSVKTLQSQMGEADAIWDGMVEKYGLEPHKASELASWWHTDGDIGREIECFTDMRNSRERGFLDCEISETSFFDVFDRLIAERTIPDFRNK